MKVKIKRCLMVFLMAMGMLLSAMTASAYQSEDMQVIEETSFAEDEISAAELPDSGEALDSGNLNADGVVIERNAVTNGDTETKESQSTGRTEDTKDSQTVGTVQGSGTGETPFSIPGNGLLLDDKSEDGTKQFFTIRTKNGNTFFMVLDRSNNTENVYMLSMIDENDLAEFIKDTADQSKTTVPSLVIPQKETTVAEPESIEKPGQVQTEPEKKKTGMNTGTVFVLIVMLAGGIGVFYYLKVVKPKREEEDAEVEDLEFIDDETYINEDEGFEEDDEDEE